MMVTPQTRTVKLSRVCFLVGVIHLTALIAHAQRFDRLRVDTTASVSFRGLSVVDDSVAWVSGTKGFVGRTRDGGSTWTTVTVEDHEEADFRSIYAFDSLTAVIANAGSPAYIMRTTDGGTSWEELYENDHDAAFIDGVDFWDGNQGLMYGDPIDGRLLIVRTTDGGRSWSDAPVEERPAVADSEYSFAASGTGIRCLSEGRVVISTGGSVSRLIVSEDMGTTWRGIQTPILQGISTAGIFSFAFFDAQHGVIVGGDFQRMQLTTDHVFYTTDGGTTWTAPKFGTRGYRECAEVVDSVTVIATGPTGTDVSSDRGKTWMPMSNEKEFHVIRKARTGTLRLIAGGKGKVSRVR